jgi:hypothetical protein
MSQEFVVVKVEKDRLGEVMAHLRELGDVVTSTELWGESDVCIGGEGRAGHMADMKDLHYESEAPADD